MVNILFKLKNLTKLNLVKVEVARPGPVPNWSLEDFFSFSLLPDQSNILETNLFTWPLASLSTLSSSDSKRV